MTVDLVLKIHIVI